MLADASFFRYPETGEPLFVTYKYSGNSTFLPESEIEKYLVKICYFILIKLKLSNILKAISFFKQLIVYLKFVEQNLSQKYN